ncbi:MAG TPA: ABC transporter permease [Bryobacteraceae bacterium]|jgi:predicted permease
MQQLRYAVRALRRNPAFTLPAVLALTLGIGAVTIIFSLVDAVLLRPLPYPDSDRLVSVSTYIRSDQVEMLPSTEFLNWRRDNGVLQNFAAIGRNGEASLIDVEGSVRIRSARVTTNLLATLGVSPVLGRDFLAEEGRTGGADAAIVSYGLWQSRFGADPAALGKNVNIDGTLYRVVGVLPRGLLYLPNLSSPDVLTPLQISPEFYWDRNQMRGWQSIGRLKPGVTLAQGRAAFEPLMAAARRDFPRLYRDDVELRVVPYRDRITGSVRVALMLLLGVVGCVLLIACANVANLLLARGASRRKELAVRVALGAGRGQLIRHLLTESAVLALAGGTAGATLAFGVVSVLRRAAPLDFPRIAELTVDARVLAFVFLVSLTTGLVFGLAPSLSATRMDMKGLRRGGGMRAFLVSLEVALSLILLVGAGLLLQSLWRLQHKHLGFQPDSLLVTNVSLRGSRFAKDPLATFYPDLSDRVLRIPGTVSVAFADGLPPNGGCCATVFVRDGAPRVPGRTRGDLIVVRNVSTSYFETLGIPLIRGRLLTATDRDSAVINETMARHFFPGQDPIGIRVGVPRKTIVGIVGDVKNDGLNSDIMPETMVPLGSTGDITSVQVLVRSLGDAGAAASALRGELREMDPRMLVSVNTMRQQFTRQTAQPRSQSQLFASFAAVALLLAMIGIYAVVAFTVANRTKEIGIRRALGAEGGHITRLILWSIAGPIAVGLAIGIAGSLACSRFLRFLLYDIKPTDPLTYVGVAALLAAVAVAASLLPARRACLVDPMHVLRSD